MNRDTACRSLALTTVALVFAPTVYLLFCSILPLPGLTVTAAVLGACFLGRGAQVAYAAIRRYKPPIVTDLTYEGLGSTVKPSRALPPLLLAPLLGYAAMKGMAAYIQSGALGYYDRSSLHPIFAFAVAAVFFSVGVLTWFSPFGRLVSYKTAIGAIPLIFIEYIFPKAMGMTDGIGYEGYITFCLIAVAVLAFILLAQSSVTRNQIARGGMVGYKARTRILGFSFLLLLAALLIFAAVVIVYTGVSVIVRSVAFFLIRDAVKEGSMSGGDRVLNEAMSQYQSSVLVKSDLFGSGGTLAVIFTIIFIGAFALTVLLLVLRLKYDVFGAIKRIASRIAREIADFFAIVFEMYPKLMKPDEDDRNDYSDEKLTMDESSVAEYAPAFGMNKRSFYREFTWRLASLNSDRERICYAYKVLVGIWMRGGYGIEKSDTPRTVLSKLREDAQSSEHAEALTNAFELIRYADRELSPEREEATLSLLCDTIRRYYA